MFVLLYTLFDALLVIDVAFVFVMYWFCFSSNEVNLPDNPFSRADARLLTARKRVSRACDRLADTEVAFSLDKTRENQRARARAQREYVEALADRDALVNEAKTQSDTRSAAD